MESRYEHVIARRHVNEQSNSRAIQCDSGGKFYEGG
jgi:hypothetical protein